MSKQRYLDTKFWDDNYIILLDPVEKLLFIYFLTNPLTNILGIYEISLRRVGFDTGIDKDMVLKILERFERDNKIKYEQGYIVMKNFMKHQKDNPKINKGIEVLIKEIPIQLVKWAIIEWDRLSIDYDILLKATNYLNTNTNTNINTNSNINDNKKVDKIYFNYKEGKFEGINKEYIKELKTQYPNCNIDEELTEMTDWLIDHSDTAKKRVGSRSFINNWLKNNYNKPTEEPEDNMPTLK